MLDEKILIIDVDPDHWTRLFTLFGKKSSRRSSILFLIVDQGVCLKAIHSEKGALLYFDYEPGDLAALAEREQVDYVARVERDFFQKIFAASQQDVNYDSDYIEQLMTIFNGALGYAAQNITWYPHRPVKLRPLRYDRGQKLFDRFLPDGKTFFFCVLDEGRPYTSLILGKRSGNVSLLSTLDALGIAHDPFDPQSDLDEVTDRIQELFEKVHLSFVIERRTFQEMTAGRRPVTYLCAAMKHGRAFMEPMRFSMRLILWAARVFKKL